MESSKKIEMLAKLDAIYEEELKNDPKAKVQDVIKSHMNEIADEYGIDPVDLFIDYMDHVALTSKKLGMSNGDETQVEIDFNDLESIKL